MVIAHIVRRYGGTDSSTERADVGILRDSKEFGPYGAQNDMNDKHFRDFPSFSGMPLVLKRASGNGIR